MKATRMEQDTSWRTNVRTQERVVSMSTSDQVRPASLVAAPMDALGAEDQH